MVTQVCILHCIHTGALLAFPFLEGSQWSRHTWTVSPQSVCAVCVVEHNQVPAVETVITGATSHSASLCWLCVWHSLVSAESRS